MPSPVASPGAAPMGASPSRAGLIAMLLIGDVIGYILGVNYPNPSFRFKPAGPAIVGHVEHEATPVKTNVMSVALPASR